MKDKQPYINDISDIEIHLDNDDEDHLIIRLFGSRGWISCRIQAERLIDAMQQVETDLERAIADQLRDIRRTKDGA